MLEFRTAEGATALLTAARRADEQANPESVFAVPGLRPSYGTSYATRSGLNAVQVMYARDRTLVVVSLASSQRWVSIDEAVDHAREQYRQPQSRWLDARVALPVGMAVLPACAVLLPAVLLGRRRRSRRTDGPTEPTDPAGNGDDVASPH